MSKVAEDFVVEFFTKPAVLKRIDRNQYGMIPNSSTFHALVSMTLSWSELTDGNGGSTRVILFDFRKAVDLVNHYLLLEKLKTYDLPQWTIDWIKDFLTCRKRVKLNQDCYSEWEPVTAGVAQGTKLGLWLFTKMINDLVIPTPQMWKFVDDPTLSEVIKKRDASNI